MAPIHVLHVDDEPDFAELAATALERVDDRFDVTVETSAADGLDHLADANVDCVVSDYQMPGMDGLEFLDTVRENYPDLPFILFTGRGSEGIASDAISAGATDYLQKSSGTEQYEILAHRIRNAVEQARTSERARNLERIRTLVGELNQALVRATTREQIETEVCEIISDSDPYSFVWVGDVEDDSDRIRPRASAGMKEGYLDEVTITTDESPTGRGPGGTAIRDRRVVVAQDIQNDPQFDPWREAVKKYGVRSVAAIPLEHEGILYGLLVVYTDRPYAFDEDERALLAEVGDDIAHAIDAVTLRTELERYETIIEALGDPVYTLDENGRYTFVNEAFVDRTGYPREKIIGAHVSTVLSGADIERGEAAIRQLLDRDERTTETFEMERETADGDTVQVENNIALLPSDDGQFAGTAGILRDITERKQREQQLQETTARLEALIEATPVPIIQVDTDLRVDLWNPAAEDLFGWDREEVLGAELPILPDDVDSVLEDTFERVAAGERIDEERVVRRTKDGRNRELLLSGAPVFGSDGSVIGCVGVFVDIEDRLTYERTVEQLHSATRELISAETEAEILQRGQEVVVETLGFPHTAIRLYDPDAERLTRRVGSERSTELMGERPRYGIESSPPGRAFRTGDSVRQSIGSDDPYDREGLAEALYVPIGDQGVISIGTTDPEGFTDADVKLAEILAANIAAALTEAERERNLRRQNERLEEFTSIVSHDLRNPLSVAMGRVQLAREESDSTHLESVVRAHKRMETLIEDLLMLAKQGEPIDEMGAVDVTQLVTQCWQFVDTAEATLEVDTELVIQADEGRLRQLLENLFRNAIEHGGPDVTITVGPLEGESGFFVADDGPGIPAEKRDQVFESGYSTADEGTGFGLSIVNEIVQAHDWEIRVTESADGGARFEITDVEFEQA